MSSKIKRPTLLFIDDVIEDVESLARLCQRQVDVLQRSFDDVDETDLDQADLILIDFNLKDWASKDRAPEVTLRPADGLAVVEILRSYYRSTKSDRPVALAVLSGDLASLTHPFPPSRREHMVADLAKVDWAFQKGKSTKVLSSQLISLAEAVQQLPKSWPRDSNSDKDKVLHNLLAIPQADWNQVAAGDVSRCFPPIRELSTWSHGIAFLRWMLQRVLPYPAFLLDDAQVALRIGISIKSFCAAMENNRRFKRWLHPALYSGVLSQFRGRRWWKAGIDALLWELSQQKPFSKNDMGAAIMKIAPEAVLLKQTNPVACVNIDYEVVKIAEAAQCVRLRPDDWPLFADSAWAERKLVIADQSLLMAVEDFDERTELEATNQ